MTNVKKYAIFVVSITHKTKDMNTVKEIIEKAIELKADEAGALDGKIWFKRGGRELAEFDTTYWQEGAKNFNIQGEEISKEELKAIRFTEVCMTAGFFLYDDQMTIEFFNTKR